METITETINNGESEVQVATIGKVIGSGIDGSPVEQNFTEESLQKIANNTKDEILVDADHSSEKNGDTSAKGWLSNLKFIPGKGLFGKIKWTDIGRKLIENRVFRWLSPSWMIDKETKEPVVMTSCALTNKPSQIGRIDPIVNSQPIEQDFTDLTNKDILQMTKEELKELIKSTIEEIKAEKAEEIVEKVEETKEEVKAEEVANEETVEEKKEVEEVKETAEIPAETAEVVAEEPKAEEPTCDTCAKNEEVAEVEEKKEEEKKEEKEVIPLETLNSAPIPTMLDEPVWKKMTPEQFCKWYDNGRK